MKFTQKQKDFLLGFTVPLILTIPFWLTRLDVAYENLFFDPATGDWPYKNDFLWSLLYHYGFVPLILLALASLAVLISSFFAEKWKKYRLEAGFILMALILGPGYLVNATSKEYTGRPRPRDIQEFGGVQRYLFPFQPGTPGRGKSFPSGHAASGFAVFIAGLALRKKNPKLANRIIAGGFAYGLLMGIGRNVQGAHYPTDIIWAGGMVWLSSVFTWHYLFFSGEKKRLPAGRKKIIWVLLIWVAFQSYFIHAHYKAYSFPLRSNGGIKTVSLVTSLETELLPRSGAEAADILTRSWFLGPGGCGLSENIKSVNDSTVTINYLFSGPVFYKQGKTVIAADTARFSVRFFKPDSIVIRRKNSGKSFSSALTPKP
jgi:membrane-associated PAP2 superfamily phosphatase